MNRMNDDEVTENVFVGQFDGSVPKERPKKRWMDSVEGNKREMDIRNWKVVALYTVVESAETRFN